MLSLKKVWSILAAVVLLVGMFGSVAGAFKQTDVDKLLKTNVCDHCDLLNANLTGAKLTGANLIKANLMGSKGANLTGAMLNGATMPDGTVHQ